VPVDEHAERLTDDCDVAVAIARFPATRTPKQSSATGAVPDIGSERLHQSATRQV
jgi:hypothetical protein